MTVPALGGSADKSAPLKTLALPDDVPGVVHA